MRLQAMEEEPGQEVTSKRAEEQEAAPGQGAAGPSGRPQQASLSKSGPCQEPAPNAKAAAKAADPKGKAKQTGAAEEPSAPSLSNTLNS